MACPLLFKRRPLARFGRAGAAMETEAAMQLNLQKFAITAVFTLTCFTVPVMTASAATESGGGSGASAVKSGSDDSGVVPVQATIPDWSKGAIADEVKSLQTQFKQQQKELMQKYQELLKGAKDASKEEREKLRAELKDQLKAKLDELIAKQKELRAEIKQRFEEHQELIDAAKEKAKERVRERRGNGKD